MGGGTDGNRDDNDIITIIEVINMITIDNIIDNNDGYRHKL